MRNNSSVLLKVACWIAHADYDLACESNDFDRKTIINSALLLLMLAVVAFVAWTAFWSSFLSLSAAIPLGAVIAALVFLIDQAVSASDWELAGVLRTSPRKWEYWLKVLGRGLIAFFLASATATGATLWILGDSIENHLQARRIQSNEPIEAEYARRKLELKERLIIPVATEIKAKQREREVLREQIEQALKNRDTADMRSSNSRIEAGREDDGDLPGYVKGKGPKYREAKRQEMEANLLAKKAREDVRVLRSRMDEVEDSIAQLSTMLATKEQEYRAGLMEIETQKTSDTRWVPSRNDPLMRYLAIHEIRQDPVWGDVAGKFITMMVLVLFTVELSFLFVKIIAPASVYSVRLIGRTKREAAQTSANYARDVSDIKDSRPRGNLRIVGSDQDQPEGEQP